MPAEYEWPPGLDAALLDGQTPGTVLAERFGMSVNRIYGRRRTLRVRAQVRAQPGPRKIFWSTRLPLHWLIAKTCIACGRFCQAADFRLDDRYGTRGSYRSECFGCSTERAISNRHKDKRGWDVAARTRMQHVQAEVVDAARNRGKEWTGPELEVIARTDLSDREKALMLGRTFYAVRHQVTKLNAGDPKTHIKAGLRRGSSR